MLVPREKGIWPYSLVYLLLLSLFFFGSYGFANWLTSLRSDVGVIALGWEKSMPLWPWTIIPYWSIDLFYGLALLLAPTKIALLNLAKRLLTAQIICIIAFLFWPLMFSFQRPVLDGYFAVLFDILMGFDKPFNQAPSLHITLLVILWVFYAQYLKGIWGLLLHIWFGLIALSVLTTWQHHFLDVPTGALAGAFCVWLWPQQGTSLFKCHRQRLPKQWRWAMLYGVCACVWVMIAVAVGSYALCLLWPAVAFAITALNYAALGARGFQKQSTGQFERVIGLLLLPYRMVMWLNSRFWTWRDHEFDAVTGALYLGRMPTRKTLHNHPFYAVVDLCAELAFPRGDEQYTAIPVLDMTAPTLTDCQAGVLAIEQGLVHGNVLVCCALGYSRSATIVLAWLLYRGVATQLDDAIEILAKARPRVVIGPKQLAVLNQWVMQLK